MQWRPSLAKVARPSENGQGDYAASGGGEKRKHDTTYVIGRFDLNSLKIEKKSRILEYTKFEMEIINNIKEYTENSNLNRQEYDTVMSSEANEIGLEQLLKISRRAALQRYSDETVRALATVAAYLAYPCA